MDRHNGVVAPQRRSALRSTVPAVPTASAVPAVPTFQDVVSKVLEGEAVEESAGGDVPLFILEGGPAALDKGTRLREGRAIPWEERRRVGRASRKRREEKRREEMRRDEKR